jgi:hypothetical protein
MKLRLLRLSDRGFLIVICQESAGRWQHMHLPISLSGAACLRSGGHVCMMPCVVFLKAAPAVLCICAPWRDRQGGFERVFQVYGREKPHRDVSRIENVTAEDLARFDHETFRHYKKCDEYMVRRRDMVALAGNSYRHQRNLCNYFQKHYRARLRAYRPADRCAVLHLHDRWAQEKRRKSRDEIYRIMLDDSRQVLATMLGSFDSLKAKAVIVECGGRPEAFSSGFFLSDGKFCINFEFADLSFKGIAAYVFREFSRRCGPSEEINIMDAVGLDNVRRTKEMYHPAQAVPNYTVLLKDDARGL